MNPDTIFGIFIGIGLAASVGFRVFVPLFALSIAAHFNLFPLNENWEWVGSATAILILGIATFVEIIAYLIPWLDNLLDSIAIPLAAIAGTAVMVSVLADLHPAVTWALAIIAGGGTATAIKTSTSAARLTSTTTTGGLANPVISSVETGTSAVMSVLSMAFPVLAIILVAVIFLVIMRIFKPFKKTKEK